MEEEKREHNINMESRKKITVSGVEDIESFDEEKVVIYTSMGTLSINGYDFKINKLSVDDGCLVVEGDIYSLEYSDIQKADKNGGFLKRMFR